MTRFELATSTSRTKQPSDGNAVKRRTKRDNRERLHQCLHQIAELVERDGPETLVELLVDSLDSEALERLVDALNLLPRKD